MLHNVIQTVISDFSRILPGKLEISISEKEIRLVYQVFILKSFFFEAKVCCKLRASRNFGVLFRGGI